MAKASKSQPLLDVLTKALKDCFTLWPLFASRILLAIVNNILFVLFLACVLGSFLLKFEEEIMKGIRDPGSYSWDALWEQVVGYFLNWEWVLFCLVLLLVFVTLASLLAALVEGGICSSFWTFIRTGKKPTLESFTAGAKANLVPLVCLQALLFLLGLVFFMITLVLFGLLFGLGFLAQSSFLGLFFICFLLGLPAAFLWIGSVLLLAAFGHLCTAHLTSGAFAKDFEKAWKDFGQRKGRSWLGALLTLLWEQLRITYEGMVQAYGHLKANRWRFALGLVVAFLLFFVFMFAFRMVFAIFNLIPIIGLLFMMVDFVFSWCLTLMSEVYFPALAISLLSEDE